MDNFSGIGGQRLRPAGFALPTISRRTGLRIMAFGLVNWLAFLGGCLVLGGDAASGTVAGGHYFLGDNGRFTEVSQAVFTYSQWHRWIAFAGIALALVVGWRLKQPRRPADWR